VDPFLLGYILCDHDLNASTESLNDLVQEDTNGQGGDVCACLEAFLQLGYALAGQGRWADHAGRQHVGRCIELPNLRNRMTTKTDNELRAAPRVMTLTAWNLERYKGVGVEPPQGGQVDYSASLSWEITFVRPGEVG